MGFTELTVKLYDKTDFKKGPRPQLLQRQETVHELELLRTRCYKSLQSNDYCRRASHAAVTGGTMKGSKGRRGVCATGPIGPNKDRCSAAGYLKQKTSAVPTVSVAPQRSSSLESLIEIKEQ